VLGALTVVGAALRLPFLGLESLWYDETFTLSVVEQDSLGALLDRVRETESTPPLYYLVTWAFTQLVDSTGDAALRAPAALAGVLCVPASYLAVRRLCGERIGLAVAALTAVSPVLVEYSLNARAYPLVVLFGCLSLWALGEAVERRGGRWLAAWAVFAALALWTHYYAGFLVAAELVALLWLLPGARTRVAMAGAGLVVACLPLLSFVTDQRDERASHIDSLALDERVEQALRQLAAGANPPSRVLEALAIALAIGGIAAGAGFARRLRGPALLGALGAAAVAAPLLLAVTGIDDHFFMRNLLVAWACMAALAAVGLTRARGVPLAAALLVAVALVIGGHADWRHQNADWQGALRSLGREAEVPIVVMPGLNHAIPNAYLRRQVAFGAVVTDQMWVLVEPGRAGRPDLRELPGFPRSTPPGFRRVETRTYRGFRLVHFVADGPTQFDPTGFGPDQIGQQTVTLTTRAP
jgi:4-amino-4-deoxy-L-arabinose transferase-like glycosyltransferase